MLTSLIGTYWEGMPAGGRGCTVRCVEVNGAERKSDWCSLLAKQTSKRDMSSRGTTPTDVLGRSERIGTSHFGSKVTGSRRKQEEREEEGGKRTGVANCSKFTAHSVGSAGGGFLRATSAQVQ